MIYLWLMNWGIIHDCDWSWPREWVAEWQKLVFDEIFEQFLWERSVFNMPSEKTIDRICRKNQPSFTSEVIFSWGWTPFGDQLHFRWLVSSFAADSSTNISWLGVYIDILCAYAVLSSGFLCMACSWIKYIRNSHENAGECILTSSTIWLTSTYVELFVHQEQPPKSFQR